MQCETIAVSIQRSDILLIFCEKRAEIIFSRNRLPRHWMDFFFFQFRCFRNRRKLKESIGTFESTGHLPAVSPETKLARWEMLQFTWRVVGLRKRVAIIHSIFGVAISNIRFSSENNPIRSLSRWSELSQCHKALGESAQALTCTSVCKVPTGLCLYPCTGRQAQRDWPSFDRG